MRRRVVLLPAGLAMLLIGCGHRTEQYLLPDQITDFPTLFASNCSGCHGMNGRSGAARPLNDPVFLALIGKEKVRDTIAKGVPQTSMPSFAQNAGGGLTDQQIGILADQMEARWSKPQQAAGSAMPSYSGSLGDPEKGGAVFERQCTLCHGAKRIGGLLTDPDFLALVSDQSLRTSVIAGRSDRGMPNWMGHRPPLTSEDISDVVAWLASHRARSTILNPVTLTSRGTSEP
jgi:cytochrome c oxidase cbb3-type subunit 3